LDNGRLETTITISEYGGCGIDSAAVYLHDVLIGHAPLNVRSPDNITVPASFGWVDILDFVEFLEHYTSSPCNCVHPNDYSECSNFAGVEPDTLVDMSDFALYGIHHGHNTSSPPPGSSPKDVAYSGGNVELLFVEDIPLTGRRALKVSVLLKNAEKYSAMFMSFKNDNSIFKFNEWHQDPAYPRQTLCTEVIRNGQKEIILGVIGGKNITGSIINLGYFELDVYSDSPLELTSEDFALVTADLLETGGDVLTFRGTQVQHTVSPTIYRNALAQNYPNPFNPSTTIAYSISSDRDVELLVYDVTGALVKRLVDGPRKKNNYKVIWDGNNNSGNSVASGVYFYRLIAGDFKATKKMVLLR
jgi:hypothetical protein